MRWGWIVLVVSMVAAPARAQRSEAERLYLEAQKRYEAGEFTDAATLFKQSYDLSHAPALLFNLAQAYRLAGDCRNALFYYRDYLRLLPTAPNKADVDARIAELSPRCPSVPPASAAPSSPRPPDRTDRPGRGKRLAGLIAAGGGVVLAGVGGFFSYRAVSTGQDATDKYHDTPGTAWDSDYETRGKRAEKLAAVFYVAGGAAVIGGTVLYLFGIKQDAEAARVAVVPRARGVGVAWEGRF